MSRRPSSISYRRRPASRRRNPPQNTAFSGRLTASALLFAFVIIISCIGGNAAAAVRKTASAIIGRNILSEIEDKGNVLDNMTSLVKCMFSFEDKSKKEAEEQITQDIKNSQNGTAASDSILNTTEADSQQE